MGSGSVYKWLLTVVKPIMIPKPVMHHCRRVSGSIYGTKPKEAGIRSMTCGGHVHGTLLKACVERLPSGQLQPEGPPSLCNSPSNEEESYDEALLVVAPEPSSLSGRPAIDPCSAVLNDHTLAMSSAAVEEGPGPQGPPV